VLRDDERVDAEDLIRLARSQRVTVTAI